MRVSILGLLTAGAISAAATAAIAANEPATTLQKSFPANKVIVDGFSGTITITTATPGAPIAVRASGKPEDMKRLDVRQGANGVSIRYVSQSNNVWWPWSVLDWSQGRQDNIAMTIGAPKGTEFDMDGISGRVSAGDLDAPLRFGGSGGGTAKFGNVTRARIEVSGSMDIAIGNSQGPLDVEISGSGSVVAGAASQVKLDVSGSGEFTAGALSGGLTADFDGSSDATIDAVNGPVSLDLSGSNNVIIKSGRADPFRVSISGSGDVNFGGEAVDPEIEIQGSGNVTVGSLTGSLKQDIQGSGDFIVRPAAPAKPTEPSAPAKPAEPAAPPPPAPPAQ